MEDPRTLNRLFWGMVVALATLVLGLSIFLGELSILLSFLAAIGVMFVIFGFGAVANLIVFGPLIWLMARFTTRNPKDVRHPTPGAPS
jgi:uncharacterized integral membrane protein